MNDITLYESGSGGEFNLLTNDLEVTSALWNNIYLALFGGNVDSTHEDAEIDANSADLEYWQNSTFFTETPEKKLNSLTEITLTKTTLDSKGLNALEEVVKTDLDYLSDLGELTIEVSQDGVDRIIIDILIQESETQTDLALKFIWDATLNEVITTLPVGQKVFEKPFISEGNDYVIDFVLN